MKKPQKSPSVIQKRPSHDAWLAQVLPVHERLTRTVVALIQNMLTVNGIEFLNVEGRTKTSEGAIEKIERKQYRDPKTQLTDLSGIRVVTYLESQVEQVSQIIRQLFNVDEENSLDRTKILGSDKIGYRSTHFVCGLGSSRASLPEYASLENLKFEIQVRTVLQHGWAELAHDRSFKFGPGLPMHIQRKLNLYAGMLEIVDAAFDNLAKEIDDYASSLKGKTLEQISDEEISKITLEKYLFSIVKKYKVAINDFELTTDLFVELSHFGIKTTGDLERITTAETMEAYKSEREADTAMGFVRQVLILTDIDKYLSGPFEWRGIDEASYRRLLKKYDKKKINALLALHNIDVLPNNDPPPPVGSTDEDEEIPF